MRRSAAIAIALVSLMSSCSKFSAQSDVAVRQVPIDLAFGNAPTPAPSAQEALLPPVPLELPEPVLPSNDDNAGPPPELCPPVKAVGARDIAVGSMTDKQSPVHGSGSDAVDRQGDYLYGFIWNYQGQPEHRAAGYRTLANWSLEEDNYDTSLPGGFGYTLEDKVDPRILFGFESHPETDPPANSGTSPQDQQDHDGFFLKTFHIPQRDPKAERIPFTVPNGQVLKIADYPLTEGAQLTGSAPDLGLKPGSNGVHVPNPVQGGTIDASSGGGTILLSTTVGPTQIIAVCADLAQGWKVSVSLQVQEKGYNIDLNGFFWFDTAYGGMPIREEFTLSGDLIQGNFFEQMMRLDPGDYI